MQPYDELDASQDHADAVSDTPAEPDESDIASPTRGVVNEHTEALFTSLYEDLCRLARREVRRSGGAEVLSTGTLVHEAWLDISKNSALQFDEPGRFLAYAVRTMRGLVIDRVRSRDAQKRGGGVDITVLDTLNADEVTQPETLERIGEALEELQAVDADLAEVVDLKFFCGFTVSEVACIKGVSERTVHRQWKKARMLLHRALALS